MVEKSLEIIRSSVTQYVKYITPLLSVVDVQRKPARCSQSNKSINFLTSNLAGGARSGPSAIYPTPPALVALWHPDGLAERTEQISVGTVFALLVGEYNVIPNVVSKVPNPSNHQMEGKTAAGEKFARCCQQKRSM